MPLQLTNQSLDTFLTEVVTKAYDTSLINGWYLDLLYQSGARAQDALNLVTWTISGAPAQISYLQEKTNNTRSFPASRLDSFFQDVITNGTDLLIPPNYTAALRFFKRLLPGQYLSLEHKDIHLHAFRHNYARQLFAQGLTSSQIMTDMGISHASTMIVYLNRPIYIV